MKTPSKVAAAFRAYAAKARPAADRQVSEDEIAAYVAGELAGEERARVEEAISLDPEAADLARDLALFDADPPAPGHPAYLTPQELARDWERLRERLPPGAARRRGFVRLAIAASLIALPGIWLWGWSQRSARLEAEQRLAAALAPQVNVEPYTLWQPSVRGTAPAEPRPVTLDARGDAVWLRLGVVGKPSYEDYRLEVRALDRPGQPLLWRRDGLTLYSDGSFSIAFPRAALPAGSYELRIVGIERGAESRLATYRIRTPPPPAAE
jgi:hypothetical protein